MKTKTKKNKTKNKKAAVKRFYKISANGKIKFKRAGLRHNTGKKKRSLKQEKRPGQYVHESHHALVMRCLPNGLTN